MHTISFSNINSTTIINEPLIRGPIPIISSSPTVSLSIAQLSTAGDELGTCTLTLFGEARPEEFDGGCPEVSGG